MTGCQKYATLSRSLEQDCYYRFGILMVINLSLKIIS